MLESLNEYHWKSTDTNDNDFDSQADHIVGVNESNQRSTLPGSSVSCASEGRLAMNTNVVVKVVVVMLVSVMLMRIVVVIVVVVVVVV